MFKGVFDNAQEWTGIVSTLIFFSIFIIAIVMAILKKKSDVDYLANMPLQDDDYLEIKKTIKNDE